HRRAPIREVCEVLVAASGQAVNAYGERAGLPRRGHCAIERRWIVLGRQAGDDLDVHPKLTGAVPEFADVIRLFRGQWHLDAARAERVGMLQKFESVLGPGEAQV